MTVSPEDEQIRATFRMDKKKKRLLKKKKKANVLCWQNTVLRKPFTPRWG